MLTRRTLLLAALPIAITALTFVIVFVVLSQEEDRYEHAVVLSTIHDGRTSPWDNRNQLAESLRTELQLEPTEGTATRLELRFSNIIDLTTNASGQAAATAEAERLIEFALANRAASVAAVPQSQLDANRQELSEIDAEIAAAESSLAAMGADAEAVAIAERQLAGLIDTQNTMKRRVTVGEADVAGLVNPVQVISSLPLGRQSPNPARDASIAATALAFVTLLLLSVTVWRRS